VGLINIRLSKDGACKRNGKEERALQAPKAPQGPVPNQFWALALRTASFPRGHCNA
jgi:hypothetical protein